MKELTCSLIKETEEERKKLMQAVGGKKPPQTNSTSILRAPSEAHRKKD